MLFRFDKPTRGSFGPQYKHKALIKAASHGFGNLFNINRFNTPMDDLTSDSILEEWLPTNPIQLNKLFRTIHKFDSIAGPAVDLISIMPFSDVTLIGIDDPSILKVYEETISELHIGTLLPEIAKEYLVIGRVICSLLFNNTKGIWTDVIIQDPDYCEVVNIPLRGYNPKVNLKISRDFREFLASKDPRDEVAKEEIPKDLLNVLETCNILPLDPVSTLYLSRKLYPNDFIGSSIYNRILSFYALEKSLINGTLVAAKRRLRSILHITVGETDLWEPDEEDISTIAGMFMQADEDPVGAIVATRNGIETNEIRCLEGNTLISTKKGLIKIKEFVPNYSSIENPTTLPIDIMVKGLDGTYVKANKWHYRGIKPTFNYYTNSGYKINCTENHKLLTLGEFADLSLVKAGEIGNSYICIENNNKDTCGIPSDVFIPILESSQIKRLKNSTLFKTDSGDTVSIKGRWRKVFRHYTFAHSYLSYDCYKDGKYKKELDIIKQVSNRLYNNLIKLFNLEYRFEKIIKITEGGSVPCYDISIEEKFPPIFVANGILVKNSGADFWKISDEWDFLSTAKMRALGIDESLLCVTGDTLIPTENGILKIDEIGDNSFIKDNPVDIDLIMSSKKGNAKASKWYYRGISDVIETKTKSGRLVKSTENHKILVLCNNELIWKKTKDLKVGDLLCVSLNKCTREEKLKFVFPEIAVNKHATNLKISKALEYMTPDLAFILGLLVSEGCRDKNRVHFSNSNKDLLDKYKCLIKELFNLDVKERLTYRKGKEITICGNKTITTKDGYESVVHSNVLSEWLSYLGISGSSGEKNKSKQMCWFKTIPWSVLQADEESQLAYLAAYIEGDGCIQKGGKSINFYSRCLDNLRQLQIVLSSHGILSFISEKYYHLILDVGSSCKLYNKLEKYLVSKRVGNFISSENNYRKFGVPTKWLNKFLIDRKIQSNHLGAWFKNDEDNIIFIDSWGVVNKSKWNYLLYQSYKNGMYDKFLNALYKISKIEYAKILILLNSNYYYDFIVEQKCIGKHKLYDLSMEEGKEPVFVANSLIIHNSGQATYSNKETALSVFMESLRNFRDALTNEIFYEKLFPTLAEIHGFKKRTQAELSHRIRIEGKTVDKKLIMPEVNYHKQLRPEADADYLEILSTMEEKGIPVPLRTWAAAGGLNLEKILDMKEEDVKERHYVKKWKDESGAAGGDEKEEEGAWGATNEDASTKVIRNSLNSLPIWIQGKFLGINKNFFVTLLKSSNPKAKLLAKYKNDPKLLASANYVLKRMGVDVLPFDVSVVKDISKHFKKCSSHYSKKRIKNEFIVFNRIIKNKSNCIAETIENIDSYVPKKFVIDNKKLYTGE